MISKNKTVSQPSVVLKGTLSSILSVKLAYEMLALQFEPTKNLLKADRSVTYNQKYNKKYSSHTVMYLGRLGDR